mgnify:FL=1
MSEFSDYYENTIINHLLRNQAFTPPAAVYVALFTAVTGLEANNPTAEVLGGAYARQAVTLSAASGGATSNSADVTFPEATASWGTVSHVAIVDHATNITWGTNVNVLMWSALDVSKVVDSGDTFKINIGDLDITVD